MDGKMKHRVRSPEETYGPALDKALAAFPQLKPAGTALRAAVTYDPEEMHFEVPFFGNTYLVSWPGGEVVLARDNSGADIATRIVILHYLLNATGRPMAAEWMAFRNLPGGLGYDAAFRGRADHRLAAAFGRDQAGFERAARALGGETLTFGDASFMFRLLPRVWLAAVLNLADDEFPADASVLFDAACEHYLPTEDLAVLAGMLAGRLVKAGSSR
jgi:hypothetical protein